MRLLGKKLAKKQRLREIQLLGNLKREFPYILKEFQKQSKLKNHPTLSTMFKTLLSWR